MGEGEKRKGGPGDGKGPSLKKSKGGHGGRWQTPFQKEKAAHKMELGRTIEVGDQGIWVTYARGMKAKAMREFKDLCIEYGESLFGVSKSQDDLKPEEQADGEEEQDIEAAMKEELEAAAAPKPTKRQTFTTIFTNVDCLFFMKTMSPVDPCRLVSKMCEDAHACPDPMQRRSKYVNRLTPVSRMSKATEAGIEGLAREVMAPFFTLKPTEGSSAGEAEDTPSSTFAIRQNIRNNKQFKSLDVINLVAQLVNPRHKVNLTNPDKVILVEIYQLHVGISVVDGKEWESYKRYNLNELYKVDEKKGDGSEKQKLSKKKDNASNS